MSLKNTLEEINANIAHLTKSVDSMKTKVDDLVRWKALILGGVIVISAFMGFTVLLVTRFSDYVTIKAPGTQVRHVSPSASPVTPPVK